MVLLFVALHYLHHNVLLGLSCLLSQTWSQEEEGEQTVTDE